VYLTTAVKCGKTGYGIKAGPSFFIEKSKRKMIAQDIAAALSFVT